MTQLPDDIRDAVGQTAILLPQIVSAGVAFVALAVVGRVVGSGLSRALRTRGSSRLAAVVGRVAQWSLVLLGLVVSLQLLGLTAVAGSLLATGGLMAVVLGFAFRSIGENLLAGVFIGFSRAFEVGDLIESSGQTGIVRDINLRSVHVRSADGRDIFIPCTQIFTNVLVNYTRDGLRRGDFVVGIDYRHDPGEVRELLLRTARDVRGVLSDPGPSAHISAFHPQYQELRLHFWVDTHAEAGLAQIRTSLMRACLAALREAEITLSSDVSTAVSLAPVDVALGDRSSVERGGQPPENRP